MSRPAIRAVLREATLAAFDDAVATLDGNASESIENRSATELNPPELSGPFLARYAG
ncbi:hypothetical protein Q9S36_05105 [Microbacterium sp. ARD31]|uniref:hypothetical protein n=1 Tax=Microbacterium sp. ARD31 TaxID=2962576 RepID=UPI0028810FA5|nr:hypothetical protein [Microbacterium sp. ARD31]MDT0179587.1 hypothetical protein [Microbacterium sp. ARD31]